MLFKKSFDVPANTSINNPNWQKLKICKGKIIEWVIFSPDEAADLLKIAVSYHGTQIMPFSGSEWIYGFNIPVPIREIPGILIYDSPYELDIYAYNLDDSYSHEYNVYVNIEPSKPVQPGELPTSEWWTRLKGALGID